MPGYVYFIRVGDLYRIGRTDDLDRKIKKLNPDELLKSIMIKEPETLEARTTAGKRYRCLSPRR